MSQQQDSLRILAFGTSSQFADEITAIQADDGFEVTAIGDADILAASLAEGAYEIVLAEAGVADAVVAEQMARVKAANPNILTLVASERVESISSELAEAVGTDSLVEIPMSLGGLTDAIARISSNTNEEQSKTVLIVDDIYSMRFLLRKILESGGYEVLEAENGEQALERIVDSPRIDAILMDVMMPGMNGLELCQKVKSDPATANLPIIMVTARSSKENVQEGKHAGADGYIVKPFTRQVVCSRIEEVTAPSGD